MGFVSANEDGIRGGMKRVNAHNNRVKGDACTSRALNQ